MVHNIELYIFVVSLHKLKCTQALIVDISYLPGALVTLTFDLSDVILLVVFQDVNCGHSQHGFIYNGEE